MMTVNFDPVIFGFGPLQVRWYGLMYVIGFIITGFLLKKMVREGLFKISEEKVDTFITYNLLGMFLGARLAYVFIYNWDYFKDNLGELFAVWKGGLSFHGAIVGLAVGGIIFAKKHKIPIMHAFDAAVTAGSQGVFFGRMGNFINGELYGRVTQSKIGLIFPAGGPYPRHASQLYEGIMEGVILFSILWFSRKRIRHAGVPTSMFLMIYGIFRYFIEFFREPDSQLGYYFGGTTTMGQILCLLMIVWGGVTLRMALQRKVEIDQIPMSDVGVS